MIAAYPTDADIIDLLDAALADELDLIAAHQREIADMHTTDTIMERAYLALERQYRRARQPRPWGPVGPEPEDFDWENEAANALDEALGEVDLLAREYDAAVDYLMGADVRAGLRARYDD